MATGRLFWAATSRIIKPFTFNKVSFCPGFLSYRGQLQTRKANSSLQSNEISNVKEDSTKRNINILSFDGGGSRSVMELKILDDVLRLATIVLRNPKTVSHLGNEELNKSDANFLGHQDVRLRLISDLKAVKDPIHPTDVYDMIVGNNSGALSAFCLVGGKRFGSDHSTRERMSVDECIQMYCENTRSIFQKSFLHRFFSHASMLSSIPLVTYSRDNLEKILHNQFGDCRLSDFDGKDPSKPKAGAVARKLGKDEDLILFDTAREEYGNRKACEVLLATLNAPFYFDTPVKIGNDKFVNGGIGGNCPLKQAIPRAQELFEKAQIVSALSIAPPKLPQKSEILSTKGLLGWFRYFVNESTDKMAVFRSMAENYSLSGIIFPRLSPRGENLKRFNFDEKDIQSMLDAMEEEKVQNGLFLVDVVATAMAVVLAFVEKVKFDQKSNLIIAAQLAKAAGLAYQRNKEHEKAIFSYKISKRLQKKVSNDSIMFKISYDIAKCQKEQGEYLQAISSFDFNVKELNHHQADPKYVDPKYHDLIIDNLTDKVDCYLLTFLYNDAEICFNEIDKRVISDDKRRAQVQVYKARYKKKLGQLEEAVALYKEAIEITVDNIKKAKILNDLGLCFLELGIKEKALDFIIQAQELRKQSCKEESHDPLVAESFKNVGLCKVENGDYDEAKQNLDKAFNIYQNIKDKNKISNVQESLAKYMLLKCPPDYNLALSYAQQALENRKKQILKFHDPEIAKIRVIIGQCLLKTGRNEEAKQNLLKALSIIENLLSKNHPQLVEIYEALSQIYEKNGYLKQAKEYKIKKDNINKEIENMAGKVKNIQFKIN
ncbi:uncharacterized protein LOC124434849 [Xenia sp. Carnegie-2017]|uniref:uncharacterized protein LOC124434849 n=1 Tax=Xenia sp. Carnegie-2017 TaxID=2897299 RepID=UPI001F039A89|nr:uncharacterized protein LOC124434849 [Xenia sp. Carnegie-2017]